MHHHLLSVLILPWHILHYKCCGQIVKNIDQNCLQSKIFLSNNEKIGILLNNKLTEKGKWMIGQKGKLPENMRSSPQLQPTLSAQVAHCSGAPSGKIKFAVDYLRGTSTLSSALFNNHIRLHRHANFHLLQNHPLFF